MEYVRLTFPTNRPAFVDGEEIGDTNEVLRVDEGTHRFDLGKPADYQPASQDVLVTETTVLRPMVVAFTRKAAVKKARKTAAAKKARQR